MGVLSVVGGDDDTDYDKVVVLLHGGGGSGEFWLTFYRQGWYGDMTGLKVMMINSRTTHQRRSLAPLLTPCNSFHSHLFTTSTCSLRAH